MFGISKRSAKHISLMAACLLVLASGGASALTEVGEPLGPKLQEYLDRLAPFDFHGSVIVVQDSEVLLHNAWGTADILAGAPNYTRTLFSTGSVTKQFTATAILHLVAADKLHLTDSISSFFENTPADKAGITVHHLLTHSAGLPGQTGDDNEPISRQQYLSELMQTPMLFKPGSQYEYSNAGYSVLAAIIEIVSGAEYETYLRDNLFDPLGLDKTGLLSLNLSDQTVARSHNESIGYPSPADRPKDHWHLRGNGGLLSTPFQMYRWITAVRDTDLLPDSLRDLLFSPQIREYEDGNSFYGYGWVVQEYAPGDTVVWHNGGSMPAGWSCAIYDYRGDNTQIIVFSNKPMDGAMPVDDIAATLFAIVRGEPYELPPAFALDTMIDTATVSGRFLTADSSEIISRFDQSHLVLQPTGQVAVAALFPSDGPEFLPKYNGKTRILLNMVSQERFWEAAFFIPKDWPKGEAENMIADWWHAQDSLGTFLEYENHGTTFTEVAVTHCRLVFTNGSILAKFFWMKGKCLGWMSGTERLTKSLSPISPSTFAGYSLRSGTMTVTLHGPDTLTISSGDSTIVATRAD